MIILATAAAVDRLAVVLVAAVGQLVASAVAQAVVTSEEDLLAAVVTGTVKVQALQVALEVEVVVKASVQSAKKLQGWAALVLIANFAVCNK